MARDRERLSAVRGSPDVVPALCAQQRPAFRLQEPLDLALLDFPNHERTSPPCRASQGGLVISFQWMMGERPGLLGFASGQQDHRQSPLCADREPQHLQTAQVGEPDVEQEQVELISSSRIWLSSSTTRTLREAPAVTASVRHGGPGRPRTGLEQRSLLAWSHLQRNVLERAGASRVVERFPRRPAASSGAGTGPG